MDGNVKPIGRILMLVENDFPGDVRVRAEAYTLVEYGYQVTVIAQLLNKGQKRREVINGVSVYRIPAIEIFGKSVRKDADLSRLRRLVSAAAATLGYGLEYAYFTAACFLLSAYVLTKEGFDVIQLHNPPNSPFIVGAFYRVFGKKFVFDHHDLAPELYRSRYGGGANWIYRALLVEEMLCLRCANMVIATNESYKQIDIQRGKKEAGKIFVVRNGPDLRRREFEAVAPDERLKKMGKTIGVYVGMMGPQDGVDYLLRAIALLVYKEGRRDFYCVIVGKGDELPYLQQLCRDLDLEDYVWFTGFIPRADLVRYVSTADIGLDPNPSNPLNDHSTWVKVLEYMAFGKPVVSFDLKETRVSAGGAAIYVPPNDEYGYAKAVARLMDDPQLCREMGAVGRRRIRESLAWEHVSRNLIAAYDWLFDYSRDGRGPAVGTAEE